MRHTILATLLAAALFAGCGGDDVSTGAAGTTTTIRIKDFKFVPDPATVKRGVAISLPNEDRAPHTLTDAAQPRLFDSGTIAAMRTGSIMFKKPDTYKVFCELHPYMKAAVRVVR